LIAFGALHSLEAMTQPKARAQVVVIEDGPYVVSGGVPLAQQTIVADEEGGSESWREGKAFTVSETYELCRCGHSEQKPFCDGSHAKVGFEGEETASRTPYIEAAQLFEGPEMLLADSESLCAFGRFCDPKGQVWTQVMETDKPAIRADFVRQVGNCPAGRLVAWDKKTGKPLEPELPLSIGLVEDPEQRCSGPLWLRGGIEVVAADGGKYELRNRVTLCRCGASKNKPFCDGSHAAVKFRDGL
jgi:CDGSH-type Zn-finger protein